MTLTLKEYIDLTYFERSQFSEFYLRHRIICNDGFTMSVQGNSMSYCEPRKYTNKYESMEVGHPSEQEELLGDDDDVFGYVDFEIIEKIVKKHGGIDVDKTTKDCKEPRLIKFINRKKKLESL